MEIPVYLFTGFLESGKTTFLQEALEDESFNDGERALVLICEEGEAELERDRFASQNVFIEYIEDTDMLSFKNLKALTKMRSAKKVIIEYNGMWKLDDLINNTPENWILYQNMMFVDSRTFLNYNANMRELVADKLRLCDGVVFNRFSESMDKNEFHKIVRTFTRKADILYEYEDGNVVADDIQDPLPYDKKAPLIEVSDEDYALWYRDINEETPDYEDKTIIIKGRVLLGGGLPKNCFILGRHVMTCCVDDIEFCGVVCRTANPKAEAYINSLKNGDWIITEAVVSEECHKAYNGELGPILNAFEVKAAEEPEDEVAVFY